MLAIIRHTLATGDPDWPCPLPPPRTSPAEGRVWSSAFQCAAAAARAELALRPVDATDRLELDVIGPRTALAQLVDALDRQIAAAKGLADEAIADARALSEARRVIGHPVAPGLAESTAEMLREVASNEPLDVSSARDAVARAAQTVDARMLASVRQALATNHRDWGAGNRPRGLSRAEQRAWESVHGRVTAVAFAESSLDDADQADSSSPDPEGLTDDARRALEALIELDKILAEEARESLIDLAKTLETVSAWASLREAIALRGGGSVAVAGVSYKQDVLLAVARQGWGRHADPATALLVPRPDNPHDKNAIAVHVAPAGVPEAPAEHVGWLPRDLAAEYAADFERLRGIATGGYCDATIVGGFPLFEGRPRRARISPRGGRAVGVTSGMTRSGTANLGLRLDLAEPGSILPPLGTG